MDQNPQQQPDQQPQPTAPLAHQPIAGTQSGLQVKKGARRKKIILFTGLALIVALIGTVVASTLWYNVQLGAVDTKKTELIKITIAPASTPAMIGDLLKKEGLIRNKAAFAVYTRITKTQNSLQAGSYRLSPSQTTPEIVKHLTSGKVDTFNITFLPGATLAENKKVLLKAGYSEAEISSGFASTYDSPLFEGKPATSDLEGYIYGETYNFGTGATVQDILIGTFNEYEKVIKENDLVAKFKAKGLSLYEGITLASIVQRESIGGDEAQIAQVFYSRMAIPMALGSDVTYQYIADKTGVDRDVNLDSPYNTRRYEGLPPGPIAVPGKASLLGVANPAPGDYLFFLSGDDDVTYYAKTLQQHEANISAHCKVKCGII